MLCCALQDLDVVGDEEMQCPPSPLLFDTALALEDQTIRAIAEAPMDILTSGQDPELSETDDMSAADQVNVTGKVTAIRIELTI